MSELTMGVIDALCDKILADPVKRAKLMKVIEKGQAEMNNLSGENSKNRRKTPKKVMPLVYKPVVAADSPMSIFRRKLIHEQNNPKKQLILTPSKQKQFNRILENVRVYVEVVVDGISRSHYVKELMKDMGAEVHESLSNRITHIVFLDGQYKTFRYASLIKAYAVSIKWVYLCKETSSKLNEKEFPAIDFHVSHTELLQILEDIENDYKKFNSNQRHNGEIRDTNANPSIYNGNNRSVSALVTPNRKPKFNSSDEVAMDSTVTNFVTIRKKSKNKIVVSESPVSSFFIEDSNKTDKSSLSTLCLSSSKSNNVSFNKHETSKSIDSDVIPETQSTEKNWNVVSSIEKLQGPETSAENSITSNANYKNNVSHLRRNLFSDAGSSSVNQNKTQKKLNDQSHDEEFGNPQINKKLTPRKRESFAVKNICDTQTSSSAGDTSQESNALKFKTFEHKKGATLNNRNKRKTMSILEFQSESSIMSPLCLTENSTINGSANINCTSSSSSKYPSSSEVSADIISDSANESSSTRKINNRRTLIPSDISRKVNRKSTYRKTLVKATQLETVNEVAEKRVVMAEESGSQAANNKPLKRKLYNPNEPIDEFNTDYDEEYLKSKVKSNTINTKII